MEVGIYKKRWILRILCFILVALAIGSCSRYDYSSPTPGTISLKLRAYYTKFDTTFSDNNFAVKVSSIKAIRADGIKADVYQDVKSIGTSPTIYNVLGRDAYDSTLVIGEFPLPPDNYKGLELTINPGSEVVLNGYRSIGVDAASAEGNPFFVSLATSFTIEEARTTSIVLTANLDAILKPLAYTFLYDPTNNHYFISSVIVK